jgi:hypothetical protein
MLGPDPMPPTARAPRESAQRWRRLGAAAFLFFLAKGLLWLAVPLLLLASR